MMSYSRSAAILICVMLAACATRIDASKRDSTPSTVRFRNFESALLKPIVLAPEVDYERDSDPVRQIESGLAKCLAENLPRLTIEGDASVEKSAKSMIIEPTIMELKKVSTGARLLAGPFAGSSAVLLRVTVRNAETNETIAMPVFYARANAIAGNYSAGLTDNRMLVRIVNEACGYVKRNY